MNQIAPYTPSQEEKMTAMLAHVLQIFTWFLGPLVIYFAKRGSRFVAFHSVQALIYQGVLIVSAPIVGLLWFGGWLFFGAVQEGIGGAAWPIMFVFVVVIGLAGLALSGLTLFLSIRHGIKAMNGEWSSYPLIGRWARRWYGPPDCTDQQPASNPNS